MGLDTTQQTALLAHVTTHLPPYLIDAKNATDSETPESWHSSACSASHHSVPQDLLPNTDDDEDDEDFVPHEQ